MKKVMFITCRLFFLMKLLGARGKWRTPKALTLAQAVVLQVQRRQRRQVRQLLRQRPGTGTKSKPFNHGETCCTAPSLQNGCGKCANSSGAGLDAE